MFRLYSKKSLVAEHIFGIAADYAEVKLCRRCFTVNFIKIFKTGVSKKAFGGAPLNIKSLTMCVGLKHFSRLFRGLFVNQIT